MNTIRRRNSGVFVHNYLKCVIKGSGLTKNTLLRLDLRSYSNSDNHLQSEELKSWVPFLRHTTHYLIATTWGMELLFGEDFLRVTLTEIFLLKRELSSQKLEWGEKSSSLNRNFSRFSTFTCWNCTRGIYMKLS